MTPWKGITLTQWLNNSQSCICQHPKSAVVQPSHTSQIYLHRLIWCDEREHEMETRAAGGSQQGTASAEEKRQLQFSKRYLLHWYSLGQLSLQPHQCLIQSEKCQSHFHRSLPPSQLDPNILGSLMLKHKTIIHAFTARKIGTQVKWNKGRIPGYPWEEVYFTLLCPLNLWQSVWALQSNNTVINELH